MASRGGGQRAAGSRKHKRNCDSHKRSPAAFAGAALAVSTRHFYVCLENKRQQANKVAREMRV